MICGIMERGFFDSGDVRISYLAQGTGETLVLLHGWSGDAARQWGGELFEGAPNIISALADSFRVIAPDARGHGQSDKPVTPEDHGWKTIEDIVCLLDHLGVHSAHVMAYSMAGITGLALGAKYPQRIKTLLMGDSLGFPEGVQIEYARSRAEGLRQGLSFGETLNLESPLSEEMIVQVDAIMGPVRDREALIANAEGSFALEVKEKQLQNWQTKTVFLAAKHGLGDSGLWLSDKVGGTYDIVPNTNHMSLFLEPIFCEKIKEYCLQ